MQDLGAEVCELRRFAIGNFGDRARAWHQARIGCQQAVHIRPDDDLVRVERRAQDGRGIIRAAAAESREHAFRCGTDEAGHDRDDALLQERTQTCLAAFARQIHAGSAAP